MAVSATVEGAAATAGAHTAEKKQGMGRRPRGTWLPVTERRHPTEGTQCWDAAPAG